MIPQKQKETILVDKLPGERKNFQIKATGKAFHVLIDKLYSNKIGAVVREIVSNAFDSHAAAGKLDVPFDIVAPNRLEYTFKVRDYGVGMTHEQIMNEYSTIFHSSKEDTNDQVGMLGLGSKSPFSYTNTFSVTNFRNGFKHFYIVVIGNGGMPHITHIGETPSTEAQGVEISIPVQPIDINTFHIEINSIAYGLDTLPIVRGMNLKPLEKLYSKNNWAIYKNAGVLQSTVNIRQGCIIYPSYEHTIKELDNNVSIVIDLPIGSVEVTASREAMEIDDDTKESLQKAVKSVKQDLEDLSVSFDFKNDLESFRKQKEFWWLTHKVGKTFIDLCPDNVSSDKYLQQANVQLYELYKHALKAIVHIVDPDSSIVVIDDVSISLDDTKTKLQQFSYIQTKSIHLVQPDEINRFHQLTGMDEADAVKLSDLPSAPPTTTAPTKKKGVAKKVTQKIKPAPLPPPATLSSGQIWVHKSGKYNIDFNLGSKISSISIDDFKRKYKAFFEELGFKLDDVAILTKPEAIRLKATPETNLETVVLKAASLYAVQNGLQERLDASETWIEYDSLTSHYSLAQRYCDLCSRGAYLEILPELVQEYMNKFEPSIPDQSFTATESTVINVLKLNGNSKLDKKTIENELEILKKAFDKLSPDGNMVKELFTFYIENAKT